MDPRDAVLLGYVLGVVSTCLVLGFKVRALIRQHEKNYALLRRAWETSMQDRDSYAVRASAVNEQIDEFRQKIDALGDRYLIKVTDWGPDFDPGTGNLPRYRWVVSEADDDLKSSIADHPYWKRGYLMVGNSATPQHALLDAAEWVERHQYPAMLVVAYDHEGDRAPRTNQARSQQAVIDTDLPEHGIEEVEI